MKKVLMLALMAILFQSGYTQVKITGVGKLKLYSDISLINELGYSPKTKKICTMDDYFKYVYKKSSGDKIYEIYADSINGINGCYGYYNKDIRFFYVPKYDLISDLTITGLELLFYRDSLISIKCDGETKLCDALDLKYGKSKLDLKEKEHTFTYTYTGAQATKTDETYTYTWNTNDPNVTCNNVLKKWYTDKGEEMFFHTFTLSNTSHDADIRSIEIELKKRMKNIQDEKKKVNLDGF